MVSGVIRRYSGASMPPPKLLYVDCGCCAQPTSSERGEKQTQLQKRFDGWPDLNILDIYHFMRRLALGTTTDAHPLFPTSMSRLSACIFEWDMGDVALLRRYKKEQLKQDGRPGITDAMVDANISKDELALYCRRRTRKVDDTKRLIGRLLAELTGDKGRALLSVPLLDSEKMERIWDIQQRHIKCLREVENVPLYTEVGTTSKLGVTLTKYRCARGSSSLESFHLHLNRFIPGEFGWDIYVIDLIHCSITSY